MAMWCICRVASMSIKKISYVVCYYLHTNTVVIVLHSTTVATLLHVSSYYTGVFSFVSLWSNTTVVEIIVHNHQANSITLPVLISLKKRGRKSSPGFLLSAYLSCKDNDITGMYKS